MNRKLQKPKELKEALASCRPHFIAASFFSLAVNFLYLTPTLYMLQVYNRVMSSGQVPTLIAISLAGLLALVTLCVLEAVRSHILIRLGNRIDTALAGVLLGYQIRLTNLLGQRPGIVRDLDNVRTFLTQTGAVAIFDLPWMPVYLLACFMLHPVLGYVATGSMAIMMVLAFVNQFATSGYLRRADEAARRNYSFTDASLRNSEVIQAMGMLPQFMHHWNQSRALMLREQSRGSEVGSYVQSITRFFRITLQSAVIGLGAYMAIQNEVTAGVIYAASILLARTMSPVEQLVAGWRSFISARASYGRIKEMLALEPPPKAMRLPAPRGHLSVENVGFLPHGAARLAVNGVSFSLEPGERLAVIGPSGAGKSTLVRLIVGVYKPRSGVIRLDAADVYAWDRAEFGRYVGYLPQEIELFEGSVRDNIARFSDASPEQIVEAAQRADVHDLILRLPNGYETQIGIGGMSLSGGMRQRIGFARALLGRPTLLVLDEPNSNLDSEGERALVKVLAEAPQNGMTTIIVSHRASALGVVDKVLLMREGTVDRIGPIADFLSAATPADPRARSNPGTVGGAA